MAVSLESVVVAFAFAIASAEGAEDKKPNIPADPGKVGEAKPKQRTDALGDPLPKGAIARLGTLRLRGCQGPIVFSPDGKYLITAGGNGSAQVIFWDAGTGRRVKTLTANGTIMQLAFSPDGKQLAAAVNGGNFCPVWDVATGKQRFTFTGQAVAFSADGKKLISTHGLPKPTVRTYDTAEGKQQTEWTLDVSGTDNCTLSADGRFAAVPSGGGDPSIILVDLQKKIEVKTFRFDRRGVNFSRDGRRLVAYGKSGWAVWRTSGNSLALFWSGIVHNMPSFSPDGRRLAWVGGDDDPPGLVSLWVVDLEEGRPRRLGLTKAAAWQHAAAFSDDGKKLAVVTEGNAIVLVDSQTGRDLLPLGAHASRVERVAYFAEDRFLLTHDSLGLLVWEAAGGRLLRRLPNDLPPGETILPNTAGRGRIVTAEMPAGILRLRDLVTTKELRRLKGKDGYFSDVLGDISKLSPDGNFAAILNPTGIRIYDLNTGEIRCQFSRDHPVWGMEFSADGRTLEVTIQDFQKGLLPLYYDARTGRKVEAPAKRHMPSKRGGSWRDDSEKAMSRLRDMKLLDAHGRQAFTGTPEVIAHVCESSDGRYLAVQGRAGRPHVLNNDPGKQKSFLRLWDAVTRRLVTEMDGQRGTHGIVGFSPDGRSLLSRTYQPATIHLWEAATGRERLRLAGHLSGDVKFCFRTDGRVLVSGGDDTQVFLWDLTGRSPDGVRRQTQHSPQRLGELWQALAGEDAAEAYRAMWSLVDAPLQTVAWMREHLPPVVPVERRQLKRMLADLDSNEFTVRRRASEELERLGELAEPALRDTLASKPTLECRRRCEDLLAKLAVVSSHRLQAVRAVEVLENIDTAEARALLEKWRRGAPAARQTQEAKAALKRLNETSRKR